RDVAAELQRNRLVALALRRAAIAKQAAAPNPPWPENRNIFEALTPDQTVTPVAVAEILINEIAESIRFKVVVAALPGLRLIGGDDRGALIEEQRDVALEANRVAKIVAGRKRDRSAACG